MLVFYPRCEGETAVVNMITSSETLSITALCKCCGVQQGEESDVIRISRFIYRTYEPIPGFAVAQLVESLRYKLEGRGFDSRWCLWNFSLT